MKFTIVQIPLCNAAILAKPLVASLLLSMIPLACDNTPAEAPAESAPATESVQSIKLPPAAGQADRANPVDDVSQDMTIEQKIIKQASLRFETPDLDDTYAQISAAVKKHGAQVQSDTEGKDYGSVFRNVTVRIPNQRFDVFLADVGKGVSYFDRKEISARDVTEEYIDVDARLKAKKVLEARYLALLKKANKVSEILEIERELSNVREEIESKEGQLKYLQNHVAMSTVSIEFYKKTDVQGGVTVSYGSKMWNALKSGFNGISAFFIGVLYLWPLIIILVALFFFIRKKVKNRKIM